MVRTTKMVSLLNHTENRLPTKHQHNKLIKLKQEEEELCKFCNVFFLALNVASLVIYVIFYGCYAVFMYTFFFCDPSYMFASSL